MENDMMRDIRHYQKSLQNHNRALQERAQQAFLAWIPGKLVRHIGSGTLYRAIAVIRGRKPMVKCASDFSGAPEYVIAAGELMPAGE